MDEPVEIPEERRGAMTEFYYGRHLTRVLARRLAARSPRQERSTKRLALASAIAKTAFAAL
jgi:hypothetical protein